MVPIALGFTALMPMNAAMASLGRHHLADLSLMSFSVNYSLQDSEPYRVMT